MMDRALFEGVFSGAVTVAEHPTKETFVMYDGPLPADRDPSFWGLHGDHTGNKWMKYLSEKHVYHALLRHQDREGKKDWEVGIGAGGQLYSWRGHWGEAIPPQFGPWNDEVWQATTHSEGVQRVLNAIYEHDRNESNMRNTVGRAFIHGSGATDHNGPPGRTVFYCPMLARWHDPESKAYAVVNWGQSPGQPTVFYHKVLFYSRYRYLGDGVLEVTNVAFNFGDYEYGYGGIPWGGVRTSVFPELFVSNPDGTYRFIEQYYGEDKSFRPCKDSDGWLGAAAKRDDPQSLAFAFVFGRDYAYEKAQKRDPRPSLFSLGRAGRTRDGKPNSRDFTVMANSVRGMQRPGEDYWVRYYLMVGALEDVVRNAREYERKADYGVLNLLEEQASVQPLYREVLGDGTITLTRNGPKGAEPVCRVYNEPVRHSKPLFSIRELPAGRSIVTTDPYDLSRKEAYRNPLPRDHELHGKLEGVSKCYTYQSQDGKDLKWELLGFVMPSDKAKGDPEGYVKLAAIVDGPGTRGTLALGHARFGYDNLKVDKLQDDGMGVRVRIAARVRNVGGRRAVAAPRLYLKDMEASVPVPAHRLVGSQRVLLGPSEEKTVEFELRGEQLSLLDKNGDRIVEAGAFKVMVGRSPRDIVLADDLKINARVEIQQGPRYRYEAPAVKSRVMANEVFAVRSKVRNDGGTRGVEDVAFSVDGKRAETRKLRLLPGQAEQVSFSTRFFEPGEHSVGIGGHLKRVEAVKRPPTFICSNLEAPEGLVYPGEDVEVTAIVTNLGSVEGTAPATLLVDGDAVDTKHVTVPAGPGGVSRDVRFTCRFEKAGQYKVAMNKLEPVSISVWERLEKPYVAFASTSAQTGRRGGRYIIRASGADTWEGRVEEARKDEYGAISRGKVTGDFVAVVKVESQEETSPFAKAGLMVRNDMAKAGRSPGYAAMIVTPKAGFMFLCDSNQDGFLDRPSELGKAGGARYPAWLKLEKTGKRLAGYGSTDGRTWRRVGSAQLPSTENAQHVGIYATSRNVRKPCRAEFSGFDIRNLDGQAGTTTEPAGPGPGLPRKKPVVRTGTTARPAGLGPNLARGAAVTPSSVYLFEPSFRGVRAIDGNERKDWASRTEGADAWLEIDFGRAVRLTHIGYRTRPDPGDVVRSFTLTFSDGSVQTCLLDKKTLGAFQYFDIEDVTTGSVRWDALESGRNNTGAREIAAYGVPAGSSHSSSK